MPEPRLRCGASRGTVSPKKRLKKSSNGSMPPNGPGPGRGEPFCIVLEMLTTDGMVLRATAEKEGRRPSPGTTLVASTGAPAGAWKKTAARTNEPTATDRSAPRENLFRDIEFLLFSAGNAKG